MTHPALSYSVPTTSMSLASNMIRLLALLHCFQALAGEPTAERSAVTVTSSYRYWQWLPQGYEQSSEKAPLILFLHGGGESGYDLQQVLKHGIPKELQAGRQLPAIVLAPQNPDKDRLWDDRALMAFLDQRIAELRVDSSRIYLAGMSRGAHGTFSLVINNPTTFAAAIMVCGGGPVAYAKRAKDTPIWFFHGEADEEVPAQQSQLLHAAIQAAQGTSKLTLYPEVKHDSWTQAFADNAIYDWLLSYQRK
jgi:predicted peptidase